MVTKDGKTVKLRTKHVLIITALIIAVAWIAKQYWDWDKEMTKEVATSFGVIGDLLLSGIQKIWAIIKEWHPRPRPI